MHCPYCRHTDTRVLDSPGRRRRRRDPPPALLLGVRASGSRTVEQMQLTVVKRSGATEPFTREKAIAGVRKACKGRPVSEDDLACLGQRSRTRCAASGWAEVPAHEVGLAILGPLRELDEVAYLRFASVYRAFESADDFETEIAMLRAERADRRPVERPRPAHDHRSRHDGLTTDCPATLVGKRARRAHHARAVQTADIAASTHNTAGQREPRNEERHDRDGERSQRVGTEGAARG